VQSRHDGAPHEAAPGWCRCHEEVEGVVSVVEALERELEAMPEFVREGTAAAQARVMAAVLDEPKVSAAQKSLCNKELRETMAGLRALAPAKREADGIDRLKDEVAAKRAALGRAAS
jgi:hypothetical protein